MSKSATPCYYGHFSVLFIWQPALLTKLIYKYTWNLLCVGYLTVLFNCSFVHNEKKDYHKWYIGEYLRGDALF